MFYEYLYVDIEYRVGQNRCIFIEQEDVNVLPWPACSPDCNPIENCWDQLKRAVHSKNPRPTNLAELTAFLQEEWRNIDVNYVNNLIDSVERRVTSVIQSRGRSIRYWTVSALSKDITHVPWTFLHLNYCFWCVCYCLNVFDWYDQIWWFTIIIVGIPNMGFKK